MTCMSWLKIDLADIVSYHYCVLIQKFKVGGMEEFKDSGWLEVKNIA